MVGYLKKRVKFLNGVDPGVQHILKIRTAGLENSTEWTIRFFVGSPQERWLKIVSVWMTVSHVG